MNGIDIHFDVYSDTPKGKDPDINSPTLRKFHPFSRVGESHKVLISLVAISYVY